MVKLYYTPSSCGASSFIAAHVAGISLDCEIVDLLTHTTESGINFYDINPKGNVPTLVLDDGTVLNENIACLEYILDLSLKDIIDKKTMYNKYNSIGPSNFTNSRYLLKQYLSFIATELHPIIGLLFNNKSKDTYIREFIVSIFHKKMKYLENHLLLYKDFLLGDSFTIADSYLYIVLTWLGYVGLDINEYPVAKNYVDKISNLQEVKRAKNRIATIPKTTY
jgi:glutathione S-transferase